MKYLRLPTSTYKNQAVVKVDFAFDKQLIALISTQKEATYLRSIQVLLGHGSSKTTAVYTHVRKKSLANVKNPLDYIIDSQNIDNEHITRIKT